MASKNKNAALVTVGAKTKKGKNVVRTCPITTGAKTKSGRNVKSGTVLVFDDGSQKTLLTPAGKGEKFASELRDGVRYTNEGEIKQVGLTDTEKAYRSGYLDSQKDARGVFNARGRK